MGLDWKSIINGLPKNSIGVHETDHEYRDDDRDITWVKGVGDVIVPIDSLGLNPDNKEVTKVETQLVNLYNMKNGTQITRAQLQK